MIVKGIGRAKKQTVAKRIPSSVVCIQLVLGHATDTYLELHVHRHGIDSRVGAVASGIGVPNPRR